jgi:DnaJ-class molecular chaperone
MKTMIKRRDIVAARDILGLPERATMEEIKFRYRSLMHQWHPDKNPGSGREDLQAKAAAINSAYRVIMTYCGQYRYSFTEEAIREHLSAEEWWQERFGEDPIWGAGRKT